MTSPMRVRLIRIFVIPFIGFFIFTSNNSVFSAAPLIPSQATPSNFSPKITLGPRTTYLHNGQDGLQYFPDLALSFVKIPQDGGEYWLYMVANDTTYLLKGTTFGNLKKVGLVLAPSHSGFDRDYTGVGAIYKTGENTLLAFYHAEDHSGNLPQCPGNVPGFYASIMLATSDDGGATLKRAGPILQGAPKDSQSVHCDQGYGEPAAIADHEGRYLYVYFTDHCGCADGVQIGMARSLMTDGKPGPFFKYKDGDFTTPAIGTDDITHVVKAPSAPKGGAIFPYVTFSPTWQKYIMLYEVNRASEFNQGSPDESGIYVAYSDDAIHWTGNQQVLKSYGIPYPGQEWIGHPTLYIENETDTELRGTLFYAYSQSWPHPPHYLAGQPITFTLSKPALS